MLIVGLYLAVMVGFLLWDAKVGFGFEWDGYDYPPLFLAAGFWWITLPYVFVRKAVVYLDNAKKQRAEKEQTRIRIKLEDEKAVAAAMEEVEREMADFDEKLKMGVHK
jgi:hypothetical protein